MLYCLIYLSLVLTGVTACGDFYWKDYDGEVPPDAIPAGISSNKEVIYIGHAYLHKFGILMGTIINGKREITIPCYGVKRTNKMVKILCAQDPAKYYWKQVTSDKFAEETKDKCPVLGGYDVKAMNSSHFNLGTLYIGRKKHLGQLSIGNIAAYVLERKQHPLMYYPYDGDELHTKEFEVLMYRETPDTKDSVLKDVTENVDFRMKTDSDD